MVIREAYFVFSATGSAKVYTSRRIANEVILVADSSKFEKSGLAFICGFEKIHTIITDDKISSQQIAMLEKNEVKIIIA